MNSKDPSMDGKSKTPFGEMKKSVSSTGTIEHSDGLVGRSHSSPPNHWQVLLVELIHLLGLFLAHSRNAKGARATAVLFDQLVGRLAILERMPDHNGAMIVRRINKRDASGNKQPNYLAIFGNVTVEGRGNTDSDPDSACVISHHRPSHLNRALNQAFSCLAAQGIHALYLKLPGGSDEEVDRLRLSMNIVARLRFALENFASITFRYFGRDLAIPLVRDIKGIPDPNLTLVAGLNGLSAANARELVKQAAAYHKMDMAEIKNEGVGAMAKPNSFNQIFCVRSLRSQIIKPPVEINNLPWMDIEELSKSKDTAGEKSKGQGGTVPVKTEDTVQESMSGPLTVANDHFFEDRPDSLRQLIFDYVDAGDKEMDKAIDVILSDQYAAMGPKRLAERFVAVTKLIYTIDRHCQDPNVIPRVLRFFQVQLEKVPGEVFAHIVAHRQGLKIISEGRTLLVGMVQPRLFDLITLVKDHVITRKKIATLQALAFDFEHCDLNILANCFNISVTDARHIVHLLNACFDARGGFRRQIFETHIESMVQNEDTLFEIFWCYLSSTSRRKDRLDLLNTIQLFMAGLKDPKRALQFLLADLFQTPFQISYTDRNALALANILLRSENKELHIDMHHTPEEVLQVKRGLNNEVLNYAVWRFEIDQVRILTKIRAIRHTLRQALLAPPGEQPVPYEPLFLLALEREALILMALVGGHTARIVLREAMAQYGDFRADIYHGESTPRYVHQLIGHLQVIIRGMGCVGHQSNLGELKALEQNAKGLSLLDTHPAHALRVKQAMKWVQAAIKAIQVQV